RRTYVFVRKRRTVSPAMALLADRSRCVRRSGRELNLAGHRLSLSDVHADLALELFLVHLELEGTGGDPAPAHPPVRGAAPPSPRARAPPIRAMDAHAPSTGAPSGPRTVKSTLPPGRRVTTTSC